MQEDNERAIFRPGCQIEGGMPPCLYGVFGDGFTTTGFYWHMHVLFI
jgi:hypothetical protein